MKPMILPALLLSAFTAGPAHGQIEREHGSHVHGRSEIKLAFEDGHFELELTAPGSDIVGFEHAPTDAGQQAQIDAALARLNDTTGWLSFAPSDACRVEEIKAHTHGFDADNHDDDEHHEHGEHGEHGHHEDHHQDGEHDGQHGEHHDHHQHDEEHGHAEFHVKLKGACSSAPSTASVDLHRHFDNIELIVVDLITETIQNRVELTAGQTRIDLE